MQIFPLKNSIVYILVFLYLVAMVRPIFPLMEYVVNEDYIAEFLCINKDKKELECHGKCYLMQRLQEQNEEKKQNLPKIVMEEYPIGFVQLLHFPSKEFDQISKRALFDYSNAYTYLFAPYNFRPPGKFI